MIDPVLASLGLSSVAAPVLDDEQKELLDLKIEEIPLEKLFIPVPLAARLTLNESVAYIQELALE